MTALEELARLANMAPRARTDEADWARVRETLGFDVPADYRELIDRFGPGVLDGYIKVMGARTPPGHNLVDDGLYYHEHLTWTWSKRPDLKPARLRDREVTLIDWAVTEDAAHLFWVAEAGVPPGEWEQAILDETDAWEFHRLGSVEMLLGLVTDELPTELIPTSGFERKIVYYRYLRDDDS